MAHSCKLIFTLLFIGLCTFITPSFAAMDSSPLWHSQNARGEPVVKLYFFWSKTCPHCAKAHPFIDKLAEKYPWVELNAEMVTAPGALARWQHIAEQTGQQTTSVPFIGICGQAVVGYNSDEVTGQFIEKTLRNCYSKLGGKLDPQQPLLAPITLDSPLFGTCSESSAPGACDASDETISITKVQPVDLPLIGTVAPEQLSLPLLTLVLAGVDAFNPCAFFVLLFLLSIMVNAKSRSRMLIVGGIFVFFSGLIYFLFMTAWLNMFELLGAGGDGGTIILIAGLLALVAGGSILKSFSSIAAKSVSPCRHKIAPG